jgi:glycosyltransferase involved in cell wall biosynthesis
MIASNPSSCYFNDTISADDMEHLLLVLPKPTEDVITLSFIVPAYNEERGLGATLDAIRQAAAGVPFEVIVVDDASTDQTSAVAASRGATIIRVAYRQIAATRNAGARAATGDLLFFVDADTTVSAAILRSAIAAVRDGAVGGGAPVAFDGPVPLYVRLLLRLLIVSFRMSRLAAGCFVFCTRKAFLTVGGFNEAYYCAEEVVLSRALGRLGRFVVLHESVTTSARKFRSFSTRELLTSMFRIAIQGPKGMQRREGLELWYGERRNDPPGE